MKLLPFFLLFSFGFYQNILAQNEKPTKIEDVKIENTQSKPLKTEFTLSIEGQLGVYTNGDAFFVNFGGPAVRVRYKKVSFAWVTAPTLRFWEDAPRPFIIPTVGTGFEFTYKRFGIGFPFFYNAAKNEWTPTAGLVYKFK